MDLQNYYEKATKTLINKKKNNKFKNFPYEPKYSQKKDNNEIFSKGVLAGSFYVKYSRQNAREEGADLHANSMVKARLQGNILEVIRRNAKTQHDHKEKPLETVVELPSKMFSATRDAPDISLFKKPMVNQGPRPKWERKPEDTLPELQNTIQFVPPVTSTPFGQQKLGNNNKFFASKVTPLPIRSQEPPKECIEVNMNEKYEKMCEIMNNQSDHINKVHFKGMPTQLSDTKRQLQEIIQCCGHDKSLSSNETPLPIRSQEPPKLNLNKTYVIARHHIELETPSILRSALYSREMSVAKSRNSSWMHPVNLLTQTVKNPVFQSEMLPIFGTADFSFEAESLFGSPLRTQKKRISDQPKPLSQVDLFADLFQTNPNQSTTCSKFFNESSNKILF